MILHRFFLFIIGTFTLAVVGCSPQPEMDTDIDVTEAVYFEVIGQGTSSSFTDTTHAVVKDLVSWGNYEQYMKPVIPFPEIDFSQLMTVTVAVPVPMTGVSIQVQSVERIGNDVVVSYEMGFPGSDCRGNDQPSTPYQVIMMPQVDANFSFENTREEFPCTL